MKSDSQILTSFDKVAFSDASRSVIIRSSVFLRGLFLNFVAIPSSRVFVHFLKSKIPLSFQWDFRKELWQMATSTAQKAGK